MAAEPPTIRQLPEELSSRIAAGEVVQRPVNALKEMIENSLDAGATSIAVVAKDGGLKHLSITDNGHGVRPADFPLLCERFATSKLHDIEDLKRLRTFGFRGEALSSISFVGRLTVTSMTENADCAYRAHYCNGCLVAGRSGDPAQPRPCAGTRGTHVIVEDMFYNAPGRAKALRAPHEEYRLILEMMGRYAIYYHRCAFSCKKQGELRADLSTPVAASPVDPIRSIFGTEIVRDILHTEVKNEALRVSASIYASHPQMQSNKKAVFILFINAAIKRTMENPYSAYLPRGSAPFVYLTLTLDPAYVDANISPTKSEVRVLNEEAVLEWLQGHILNLLSSSMADRTLLSANSSSPAPAPRTPAIAVLPQHLIRTDASINTMAAYLARQNSAALLPSPPAASHTHLSTLAAQVDGHKRRRTVVEHTVTSVSRLLERVEAEAEPGWDAKLAEHVYVGKQDNTRALLQFGTSLTLVDLAALSEEYFYQTALRTFGHCGSIMITPAPMLSELAMLGLQARGCARDKRQAMVDESMEVLMHWRAMLAECFAIKIDEKARLVSMPLLLDKWMPDWCSLPNFLLRLAALDYSKGEAYVFESVAVQLAHLYRLTKKQPSDYCTLLLLPAVREGLHLPKRFFEEGGVVQLTSVEQLYKVFDRC